MFSLAQTELAAGKGVFRRWIINEASTDELSYPLRDLVEACMFHVFLLVEHTKALCLSQLFGFLQASLPLPLP